MSYTNDYYKIFANINIFLLINLEVALKLVFLFRAINFMLLHSFLSKSIMVLIFLFLKVSSNFVSTSLVSFVFIYFLSFFLRASSASILPFYFFFLIFYCCYPSISKRVVVLNLGKTLLESLLSFLL